jgi:N6-adenosine-specific RNA methylase IME4
VTDLLLFGVKGKLRTSAPGRKRPNLILSRRNDYTHKPGEMYDLVETCSPGPYLELFARCPRPGWIQWGDSVSGFEHLILKGE